MIHIVVGKTLSNDGDFISNINNDTNFVMSLSKEEREIKNIVYSSEAIDYSELYLVNNEEDVYLCYNTPQNYTKVSVINSLGISREVYLFPIKPSEVLCNVNINETLEFTYINNNKIIIRDYVLGEEVSYKEVLVEDSIESIKVENKKISMMVRRSSRSIYKVYNDGKLVYELLLDNNSYLLKEDGVILCENKRINVYDIDYLIINSLGDNIVENNLDDYHDYEIIMNGNYVKHSSKTIDLVNLNQLGCYNIKYVFEDDFIFVTTKQLYVYVDVGVRDGGVYDIGTIINLSIPAVLNNEAINGKYVLDKEGSYTLILQGNNLTQELHFEVKDLSVNVDILDVVDTNVEIEILEPDLEIFDVVVNVNTITDTIDVVQNNLTFMYTLPMLLSICFAFIIIKMKF